MAQEMAGKEEGSRGRGRMRAVAVPQHTGRKDGEGGVNGMIVGGMMGR